MRIDLSSFENVLLSLQESCEVFQKDISNCFIRDSVIHRFGYTYELAHKMLKRFLFASEFNGQNVKEMFFADVIRLALSKGLLSQELENWYEYRNKRNATSHAYDEKKANEIVNMMPDFISETQYLLKKMKERLENL
ncbi:MAG: nucleotidyltransferase substrate binding protein [Planctomycetaceae bacterium]|jgi:nucleotidyltransferase substrate binding protein (TIGR01987 family)|nr:nucleotidyltransferase substrate binding protein [Planctomycetaceae bacterium]